MKIKNKQLPKVLKGINGSNDTKTIKLRFRTTKKKGFSLYLDTCYNGKRNYEFLKLFIFGKNNTQTQDMETQRLAIAIRDKKEEELRQNPLGLQRDNWKMKANFVEYFKSLAEQKQSESVWPSTYNHLLAFTKGKVSFKQIDEKFCESFKVYLESIVSQNTVHIYFSIFKFSLNKAMRDINLPSNTAQFINVRKKDTKVELLARDELSILI